MAATDIAAGQGGRGAEGGSSLEAPPPRFDRAPPPLDGRPLHVSHCVSNNREGVIDTSAAQALLGERWDKHADC